MARHGVCTGLSSRISCVSLVPCARQVIHYVDYWAEYAFVVVLQVRRAGQFLEGICGFDEVILVGQWGRAVG